MSPLAFSHLPSYVSSIRRKKIKRYTHTYTHIPATSLCRVIYLPAVPQHLDSLGVTKIQNSITVVKALIKFLDKAHLLHWDGMGGSIYIQGSR